MFLYIIYGLSDLQIRCIILFAFYCPHVDIFSSAAKLFRQIKKATKMIANQNPVFYESELII